MSSLGFEKIVKADTKKDTGDEVAPDLAIAALKAETARLRIKLAEAYAHLNQLACKDAPRFNSWCVHCGRHACAKARELLEANT